MTFQLTKGDIQIVRELARGEEPTASRLSRQTGLHRSATSRCISRLTSLGVVESRRKGRSKRVQLSASKHARILANMLVTQPNVQYEALLTGKSLDILSAVHLLHLESTREIEEFSMISRKTVIRWLAKYRRVGAVTKKEGGYRLGVRFEPMGSFLAEFRSFLNGKRLRKASGGAVLIWERDQDVLFRSEDTPNEQAALSAFSAFPRLGFDLFLTGGDYYFLSPREVTIGPEEAAVHAMLAADGPRERALIVLLILTANFREERFIRLSRIYGHRDEAEGYLRFVHTEGGARPAGFPRWEAVIERMREYA